MSNTEMLTRDDDQLAIFFETDDEAETKPIAACWPKDLSQVEEYLRNTGDAEELHVRYVEAMNIDPGAKEVVVVYSVQDDLVVTDGVYPGDETAEEQCLRASEILQLEFESSWVNVLQLDDLLDEMDEADGFHS